MNLDNKMSEEQFNTLVAEQAAMAEIYFSDCLAKLSSTQKIRAAVLMLSEFDPENKVLLKICNDLCLVQNVPSTAWKAGTGSWSASLSEVEFGNYVVLCTGTSMKLAFVKVFKDFSGLGLKDAKDVVDSLTSKIELTPIAWNLSRAAANELVGKISRECSDVTIKIGILCKP